ncbi:MAG: lysophospholipid acyltransferase family protein [Verrucomicrobiota bacterium]
MSATENRNTARSSRSAVLLGTLAGWISRAWFFTLRSRLEHRGEFRDMPATAPVIYSMWHNRVFSLPPAWKHFFGKTRKVVILTSASKDGAMVDAAMRVLRIRSVRGSSSRRGAAALVGLMRAIRAGNDAAVTPDGPKGPRHSFQPGIVKLAQATGAPIVPLHTVCESAWYLKTWDRIVIPKPFSRMTLICGPMIYVPKQLTAEEFDAKVEEARHAMLAITDDV